MHDRQLHAEGVSCPHHRFVSTARSESAQHLSSRSLSRRARSAIDEVFDGGSARTWTELGAFTNREVAGARTPLGAVWDQLASEIDRANRPRGRATSAVREVVRRIVRLMLGEGASREQIRDALVRAVMKQHRTSDDMITPPELAVREALLADVLNCAASTADQIRTDR